MAVDNFNLRGLWLILFSSELLEKKPNSNPLLPQIPVTPLCHSMLASAGACPNQIPVLCVPGLVLDVT